MKKLLFVCVLAAVVFGLLAAPALAGRKVKTARPPADVPVLFAQLSDEVTGYGLWFVNTGATDNPWNDLTFYVTDDLSPIPANTDVVATTGWLGAIYGQVKNLTKYLHTSVDITGPDFHRHFTNAQVAPYWTGPHQWDLWWSRFFGDPETGELGTPPLPFNPKIGAGVYLNHLFLPIGPFPNVGWDPLEIQPASGTALHRPDSHR